MLLNTVVLRAAMSHLGEQENKYSYWYKEVLICIFSYIEGEGFVNPVVTDIIYIIENKCEILCSQTTRIKKKKS